MSKNLLSWMLFAAFVALALGLHWHAQLLVFSGLVGAGKALVWLAWLAFVGYSIHCSRRENIVKSIRGMARLYWGRQIIIDLYLGVALFLVLIVLHQGLPGDAALAAAGVAVRQPGHAAVSRHPFRVVAGLAGELTAPYPRSASADRFSPGTPGLFYARCIVCIFRNCV